MRTFALLAAVALIAMTVPASANSPPTETRIVVADGGGNGCSGCALPNLSGQRADAAKRIVVASPRCPSGKRVMGRCLQ